VQVKKQERRLLEPTHCEIGAFYLDELNLPSVFIDALRFHHCRPTEIANSLPLVRIVYAANIMVHHDLPFRALEGLAAILSPRLDGPKLAAMPPPGGDDVPNHLSIFRADADRLHTPSCFQPA
jgi:hypothetical protein